MFGNVLCTKFKKSPNFELWPLCKYLKYMFESHV